MSWSFASHGRKELVITALQEHEVTGEHNIVQFDMVRKTAIQAIEAMPTHLGAASVTVYGHASEHNYNFTLEIKGAHLREVSYEIPGNDDSIPVQPPEAA